MKRLFLFLAIMLYGIFSFAQTRESWAGIYYYDSNSYGVTQRDSAEYYRVVESNNSFNDYYSKSNTLRATGVVSFVDAADDANTIFEGDFIAYYPNGKVWIKQFFKNGKNDGEFTEYFENGLMKQHGFYKEGILQGAKTLFDEDGNTCKQLEYSYDTTTKEPVWRDVTTSDLKTYTAEDGQVIRAYAINGLYVSVDVSYQHYYGKYYVLQLFVQNNSPEDAYFSFKDASIQSSAGQIKMFSSGDYLRRINRRQGWAKFGLHAATIATAITLEAIADEQFYRQGRHHRRTFSRDLVHDMSIFLIRQSAVVGNILISGMFNEARAKVANNNIGYLQNYVIKPNTSITGFAYAKYNSNAKHLLVNLPINGKVYQFPIDVANIKSIDSE